MTCGVEYKCGHYRNHIMDAKDCSLNIAARNQVGTGREQIVQILAGSTNSVLIDNCNALQDVKVKLAITDDLVTADNTGFSVQLNCYPPPGVTSIGIALNWIQFTLYVSNTYGFNEAAFQWQAWALGATAFLPGYPVPPGTTNPNQPEHDSRACRRQRPGLLGICRRPGVRARHR
jgi:hypothetical protein